MSALLHHARVLSDLGVRSALVRPGDDVGDVAAAIDADPGAVERVVSAALVYDRASDADRGLCAWREGDDVVLCSTASLRSDALAWAGVAHELRNALTTISGWAQLAGETSDPDRSRHALEMVQASARDAMDVAPMLLEQPVEGECTDVGRVARQVVERFGPIAGARGVTVVCRRIDEGEVRTSRAALASIVANLVKNAVEACEPRGRVEVAARATARGIEIVVEDDGRGMSDEAVAARFGPDTATAGRSGRGIGLSVVRALVSRAGGTARVSSRVGAGSCVRIELPRAQRASATSGVRTRSGGRRVLVVDDHQALADLVATTLTARGASVVVAREPDEAIEAAAAERFDVALVDLDLGGSSGEALVKHLVATRLARRVIVMSGASSLPDLGADAVLRKPFDLADMEELALEPTRVGKKRRAR